MGSLAASSRSTIPEIAEKVFIGCTKANSLKSPAAMTFAEGSKARISAMKDCFCQRLISHIQRQLELTPVTLACASLAFTAPLIGGLWSPCSEVPPPLLDQWTLTV